MATKASTPISLKQIHGLVGGELVGSPQATVTSLASFEEAGPNDLAFVAGDRILKLGTPTAAGALLAHRRLPEIANPHRRRQSCTGLCTGRQDILLPCLPSSWNCCDRCSWHRHADRPRCLDLGRSHPGRPGFHRRAGDTLSRCVYRQRYNDRRRYAVIS